MSKSRNRGTWRRLALQVAAGGVLTPLGAAVAQADTSMAYTYGFGTQDYAVVNLLWGLIIVSLVVLVVIAVLVLVGSLLRRRSAAAGEFRTVGLLPSGRGLSFIYIGTGLTAVTLIGFAAWSFATLAAVSGPRGKVAPLTIHVTGHQWWWEIHYTTKDVSRSLETANEIHIPTHEAVRLELTSADVIHSFWVPQLSGKMDMIPGQQNETWIEADRPGTYRGECLVYCGLQHAHMIISVVAETKAQFDDWLTDQIKPDPAPTSQLAKEGERNFIVHCGICHTVAGTAAGGRLGPNLTHLMSRKWIAAGTLPNTPGYLSAWIADPQHVKPGNLMPDLDLSGAELNAVRAYLETLK